jgi:cyclase
MLRNRVIPCLLLKNQVLVKTVKFKNPIYVGDPVNAVRIFNEKEVDELVFLDITATVENRKPNFRLIEDIASECFMPFGYGGGIRDTDDIRVLFDLGVEKAVINTNAALAPEFVRTASSLFGSQSIVVSIDVGKSLFGQYETYTHGGKKDTGRGVIDHAKEMEAMGAGEILLTSIDRDGTGRGYDIDLIRQVSHATSVPLVASGGAGRVEDFAEAVAAGASAVAAGSLFVFHGKHRAVLITYPTPEDFEKIFP